MSGSARSTACPRKTLRRLPPCRLQCCPRRAAGTNSTLVDSRGGFPLTDDSTLSNTRNRRKAYSYSWVPGAARVAGGEGASPAPLPSSACACSSPPLHSARSMIPPLPLASSRTAHGTHTLCTRLCCAHPSHAARPQAGERLWARRGGVESEGGRGGSRTWSAPLSLQLPSPPPAPCPARRGARRRGREAERQRRAPTRCAPPLPLLLSPSRTHAPAAGVAVEGGSGGGQCGGAWWRPPRLPPASPPLLSLFPPPPACLPSGMPSMQ